MKLKEAIESLGFNAAICLAEKLANKNDSWIAEACSVFSAIAKDPERAPGNIGGNNDDESAVIKKWLNKYQKGFDGRASQRTSKQIGTVADPIIEKIIGARLNSLTLEELDKINFAHRLSMGAENILGEILEEYLAENLKGYGWHCAWGETVKSVDFVHENGDLLQIKNRSNSENSSSASVRNGTEIEMWYRIKSDRIEYMWDALNHICKTTHLSEKSFVSFVEKTIKTNPDCLAVEHHNPWK